MSAPHPTDSDISMVSPFKRGNYRTKDIEFPTSATGSHGEPSSNDKEKSNCEENSRIFTVFAVAIFSGLGSAWSFGRLTK